jgi:hypothetical protein
MRVARHGALNAERADASIDPDTPRRVAQKRARTVLPWTVYRPSPVATTDDPVTARGTGLRNSKGASPIRANSTAYWGRTVFLTQ